MFRNPMQPPHLPVFHACCGVTRAVTQRATAMTTDVGSAVIEHVGNFADETVLVMRGFGTAFAEWLQSLGAARVVILHPSEQPEQRSASLGLVAHIPTLEWASGTLGRLREAMVANGRIVCCVGAQDSARSVISFGRMLKAHDFAAIGVARVAGHLLLSAEVPMFGPRCHA